MFKKVIIVSTIIASLAISCKNNTGPASAKEPAKPELKMIARDFSINKSNAFNDLFLDSADIETFIADEKLNDTFSIAVRSFYNVRNFEYAWFARTGLIEQAFSFRSMYSSENDSDLFNKSLENRLDKLRIEDDSTIDGKSPGTIKTELQITKRFIEYAIKNYENTNISLEDLGTFIPAKKRTISDLVGSVFTNNKYKNYAATNESYRLLKEALQKYNSIAKSGGWPFITASSKKYDSGVSNPVISIFKKRLQITGELSGNDTSEIFSSELENAVKTYQLNHGYKPTGEITASLVNDMNIPVLARMQQLIIDMQRMRWVPVRPQGKLIIVNIPEFELYVDSGKTTLFQMDVVVGAEGHNTTMFSGNVNQVVFSPYWNIPSSIVKKEVVPGLRRDKNYLKERDMEITGKEGDLPVVRQRPGPKNALGKVKFLFPNSFNIYMHDTPQKDFFNKSVRGLSHGCIRLSNPLKMAEFLLQNSAMWTPEKIKGAMNSGKEQFVKVQPSVPVIITYYTSWVDNKGALHFADDIYLHDKQMAKKIFTNPQ